MSEPWDGRGGQATRSRSARVPGQRTGEPDGPRPGGRAAARAASRSHSTSRSHGSRRARRRARTAGRGKRVLKILAICLSVLVVVTAGVGWWFYQHLNGNIQSV
ncbi:LCP family protein, partial [Streptomyces sp. NPDC001450]